jgi:GrpB-like predicted nucleotidyltransferase (UPF0157 family)
MIQIIPYQTSWPIEFIEIALVLRETLGELAERIDHIGSTAIPGLGAKDIIDVQITVASFSDVLRKSIEAAGYSFEATISRDHRPVGDSTSDSEWKKWFFRAPRGQRAINTHVRIAGLANQRFALLCRDYLRSHPDSAAAYGQLKMSLAQEIADKSRYPIVKDAAVDLIYHAANEWAIATNWCTGPSDA